MRHLKVVPKHPYSLFRRGQIYLVFVSSYHWRPLGHWHGYIPYCSVTPGQAFGSSPKHDSESERRTYTPGSQVSSRLKERVRTVQELHYSKQALLVTLAPCVASPQEGQGQSYFESRWVLFYGLFLRGGGLFRCLVFFFLMTVRPLRMMILCYSSVPLFVLLYCVTAVNLGQRTLLLCQ